MPGNGFSRRRAITVCSASVLGVAGLAACGGSSSGDSASAGTDDAQADGSSAATSPAAGEVIAATSDIAVGEAASFELDGAPIIVSMPAQDQPAAFSAVCPHQGGTVAVQGDQLVCPLHNSVFEEDTGAFVSGPADGKSLTPIEVTVEDGNIVTA